MITKRYKTLRVFPAVAVIDLFFLMAALFFGVSLSVPSAVSVNLPEGNSRVASLPPVQVYLDAEGASWLVAAKDDSNQGRDVPKKMSEREIVAALMLMARNDDHFAVTLCVDSTLSFSRVASLLDRLAANNISAILATSPRQNP